MPFNFLIQEQNTLFKKTFEKNLKQNDFQKIHNFFNEFLNISQIYDKICELSFNIEALNRAIKKFNNNIKTKIENTDNYFKAKNK